MNQLLRQKFPYFKSGTQIYFDNAATTQIPGLVIQTMADALAFRGNPYRGSHALAAANQAKLEEAKQKIASFIDADADEVLLTANATDSFNVAATAIIPIFSADDEILVSPTEHHSNLLPYLKFSNTKIKSLLFNDKQLDLNDLKNKLTPKTKLVVLQHCSNVTGAIQPVGEAINIIKNYNEQIFVIIDGSQMVAHRPISVKNIHCDAYAFSGHKMYGPDGIGILFIAKKWHAKLQPVRPGGGTISDIAFTQEADNFIHPEYRPGLERIIGGTPNVTGAIGLKRAIGFLRKLGWEDIINHENNLKNTLYGELRNIAEIKILSDHTQSIGLISFSLRKEELNEKLAAHLNKNKIAIRFGSHCSFGTRELLGTESLRISFGVYNTIEEVETFITVLKKFIEINFHYDKKNISAYKDIPFQKKEITITNNEMAKNYLQTIGVDQANLTIFAGHFLAVPDMEHNTFHPSIKPILPEYLHQHLEEFGMTQFPLHTWKLGNDLLGSIKQKVAGKLLLIANDTTGFNELYHSPLNKEGKTVEQYRQEFLSKFYQNSGLPQEYTNILNEHNNNADQIMRDKTETCFRESLLRDRFQKFIRRNQNEFANLIEYTADKTGALNLNINILNENEIKTCSFNTFNSKTGGKFCIAELTQLFAELFGSEKEYKYLSERVINPKYNNQKNIFVIYSPAMCSNAVNKAFELYLKLFTKPDSTKEYHFINIPLGPKTSENLNSGTTLTYISNRQI